MTSLAAVLDPIKKITPRFVKEYVKAHAPFRYQNVSYSIEGEDLILRRLFLGKTDGFYVDVGAYHPRQYSNTYLLWKSGWRGCNIEPNSAFFESFQKERPNDLNYNIGISHEPSELTYHMFKEAAYNTFDSGTAEKQKNRGVEYWGSKQVSVEPLAKVLERVESRLQRPLKIDLLNIDVENHEWEVLNSNDWKKYRPQVISVEIHTPSVEELLQNKSYRFLSSQGYKLIAKTPLTCTSFFKTES